MSLKKLAGHSIKEKIKTAFNRAEKSYDDNSQLQQSAGDKLVTLVKTYYSSSSNIFDLGCGTGIVTEKFATDIPFNEFHAIDFADDLLLKAYGRLSPLNIKTYSADFDYLPYYKNKFNIIFSNMALHWSTRLSKTLRSIHTLLTEDGVFAFSIPLPGTFAELERNFSTNKFISASNMLRRLATSGYDVLVHETNNMVLHFPDTFSTLKSIKLTGANFAADKPIRRQNSKSFLENLHLTSLTYVIGYFVVKKKSLLCQ